MLHVGSQGVHALLLLRKKPLEHCEQLEALEHIVQPVEQAEGKGKIAG